MTYRWNSVFIAWMRKLKGGAVLFFAAGIVVGLLVSSNHPLQGLDGGTKIDPRVLADTADGRTGHFLIVLETRADLQAIGESHSADGRVAEVYRRLKEVASTSQRRVVQVLDRLAQNPSRGVHYRAFWLVNSIAASGDRQAVSELARLPEVVRIDPDRAFSAADDVPTPQRVTADSTPMQNLTQIGAPQVWAAGDTGQGIVYANADTGVQWDHPALKNQYRGWDAASQTVDHNYNWWDAISAPLSSVPNPNPCGFSSPLPCDDDGHGTHTLGTGVGDDGSGNRIGVAPGAKWISCRNMDRTVGSPSAYISCLQFLMVPTRLDGQAPRPDLHADIISNSYECTVGEGCTAGTELFQAVQAVRDAGIFMAVSVGNSGCATQSGASTLNPPANEPNVFSVGAVSGKNQIAIFSSRGPATYAGVSYLKPDLVAPGVDILSSVPATSTNPSASYALKSGTSMSAPHVAGAVALLWAAHPELRGKVSETEQLLEDTAAPLSPSPAEVCGVSSTPGGAPNNTYGYGLLNVYAAFFSLEEHTYMPIIIR